MKNISRTILTGSIIWTAYNFLNAGILAIQEKLPYFIAWQGVATQNYIMALLSIPLWYFCKIFPFNKSRMVAFFAIHVFLSLIFSTVWVGLSYGLHWLLSGEMVVKYMISMGVHLWQFLDGITKYGLLAGIFYTINFYKKFKEKELQEAELSYLAKNMELENLKSQINPHFLFNALNSVNALMAKDPEKARSMNSKLAQLLRFSLDGYDKKFITLKQELEFIHNYLDIEKVRFGDKLQIKEEIDSSAFPLPVPSMLLQPFVENAIKHGISAQASGGELNLQVYKTQSDLHLVVSNTGKAVSEKTLATIFDRGIGLNNTRERLRRIYGQNFKLELTTMQPNGFSVKVSIPIKQSNA
ncbi:MAG: sensor histidine kinase [bacterium]